MISALRVVESLDHYGLLLFSINPKWYDKHEAEVNTMHYECKACLVKIREESLFLSHLSTQILCLFSNNL